MMASEKINKKEESKITKVKTTKKAAPKIVKKTVAKETVKAEIKATKKTTEKKNVSVSVNVFGIDGKVTGKVLLPAEIFGEQVNKVLLAQAVRVYLANQRQGTVATKTRGEVDGSTRKIYRQKGTGRARHGSVRAPIFVKGGVVFGPKPRDYSLSLPQKMKRKALFSALSGKAQDNEIVVVDGLIGIKPKTKVFVTMLAKLTVADKKQKILVVISGQSKSVLQAGRNVPGVSFIPATLVNTYEVLAAKKILVMKEAIDEMKKHFLQK
jgi:large subunit ribosomal protein L4